MTGLSCHFVWDNGHKTGHSTVISMTSSGVIFFLISFCPGSHPPRIALPEMGSTVSLIALSIYADIIHSRSGYVNHLGKEKISSVPDPAAPWLHRAGCPAATPTLRLSASPSMGILTAGGTFFQETVRNPFSFTAHDEQRLLGICEIPQVSGAI